jgi:hypothetical protein
LDPAKGQIQAEQTQLPAVLPFEKLVHWWKIFGKTWVSPIKYRGVLKDSLKPIE